MKSFAAISRNIFIFCPGDDRDVEPVAEIVFTVEEKATVLRDGKLSKESRYEDIRFGTTAAGLRQIAAYLNETACDLDLAEDGKKSKDDDEALEDCE